MSFLEGTFYGNPIQTWLIAIAVLVLTFIGLCIVKGVLGRRLSELAARTRTTIDDLLAEMLAKTKFFFLLVIPIYAGSLVLALPPRVSTLIGSITIMVLLLQAAIWGNRLVGYLISHYVKLEIADETTRMASATALAFIGRLLLWSILALLALENLGVDITALVTGLGIGGVAVALALQTVLGDLFASLSIILDKPFVVGDFIIVDQHLGAVEHIGLKTTRLRSLSGEQLVFSNNDLLKSRIRNFKRMYERRIVFSFGVVYQTPYEKLAKIPTMVRQIIESQEPIRFDRAHFKQYGDSSLNFEVVYWVKNPAYNVYMDIQQNINLALFRRFQEEGIEFAYPTQTLYMTHEGAPSPTNKEAQ